MSRKKRRQAAAKAEGKSEVKAPTPLGHRRGRWLVALIPAVGLLLAGAATLSRYLRRSEPQPAAASTPPPAAPSPAPVPAEPAAAQPAPATPPGAAPAGAATPGSYDPLKLVDEGKAPGEVYLAETRDPSWADPVETIIGGRMRADLERLVPGAGVILHCRRLSCLVGIDAPAEKRDRALSVTKFITLGPLTVDLDPEEDGTLRWLFFSEPRMGDAGVYTEWYKKLRKSTLAKIRDGKMPNPLPIPVAELPPE